jgi:phosphoribosylanthranilate isomerase
MDEVRVKICGLTRPEHLRAAVDAGAGYIGLVFFPKSPRNVSLEAAAALALEAPPGVAKVALVVNPDDALLNEITAQVPIDMLQLHGDESPERVAEIRARYGLPVMKAVGIAEAGDLDKLDAYMPVVDQILVDAKPPKGAEVPGGMGVPFDWRLIAGRHWAKPWMLAGGLTAQNVGLAVKLTGARQVDVSSGVERAPGVKDERLIRDFIAAAQGR